MQQLDAQTESDLQADLEADEQFEVIDPIQLSPNKDLANYIQLESQEEDYD